MRRACRSSRTIGLMAAVLLASPGSFPATGGANEATATANMAANVVVPVEIAKNGDLGFGRFIPSGTAGDDGTVTVSPAGVRTADANIILEGGDVGNASFTATGEAGRIVDIQIPEPVTVSGPGGATMTVENFQSVPSGTATLNEVIPGIGAATLYVGADLQVSGDQTPGDYSGSFEVTVTYQ